MEQVRYFINNERREAIQDAIWAMLEVANKRDVEVVTYFAGIQFSVRPGDTIDGVLQDIRAKDHRRCIKLSQTPEGRIALKRIEKRLFAISHPEEESLEGFARRISSLANRTNYRRYEQIAAVYDGKAVVVPRGADETTVKRAVREAVLFHNRISPLG